MLKSISITFILFLYLGLSTKALAQETSFGKLFLSGKTVYVVNPYKGIHGFDISKPDAPVELGFIRIDGVIDAVVQKPFLFANQYEDVLMIKHSFKRDTMAIIKTAFNVFPERALALEGTKETAYHDSFNDYIAMGAPSPRTSQGSMSCLAFKDYYLYAVNQNELLTFNARPNSSSAMEIQEDGNHFFGERDLETIWVQGKTLYIGARSGMHVFDLLNRSTPNYLTTYEHVQSCDPVVVQGAYAYITLRNGSRCRLESAEIRNELIIADVRNVNDTKFVGTVNRVKMTNPHGLAIHNDLLMVCDGHAGLRLFDVADPKNVKELSHMDNFFAFDVIYMEDEEIAIVSSIEEEKNVWHIFDLSDPKAPKQISKIAP